MKGRESAGAAESWAESDTAVLCRESGDWREVEESEIVLFFNESGIVNWCFFEVIIAFFDRRNNGIGLCKSLLCQSDG